MKTIKYSLLSLFLVVIGTICIVSCGENYSSPLKGIVVGNQTFETGTNNKTVSIGTKDISKCTITSSAAWCSATIQGSSVVINVQTNDTYDDRQATITLTDPEDATTLSFIVMQKQKDAIFVEKSTYDVPEEGGVVTVKIDSNVDYEIELPTSGWISITNGTRGLKKSEVTLNVDINKSGGKREGIVRFVDKETGTNESIVIKQALIPRIEIEPKSISMDENGGVVTIQVKTNTNTLFIDTSTSWMTISEKLIAISEKDYNNGFNFSITLSILPMSDENYRSGVVTFKSSDFNLIGSISVVQETKEKLWVDKTSLSSDYRGGKQYLTITSNNDFTISSPSWIRMSQMSKSQLNNSDSFEYLYGVSFDTNYSNDERNGSIKIKGKTKESTVLVYQTGMPQNPDISELVSVYIKVTYELGDFCEITAYIENNSPYTIYLLYGNLHISSKNDFSRNFDNRPIYPGENYWVEWEDGEPNHGADIDFNNVSCVWTFLYKDRKYSLKGYIK